MLRVLIFLCLSSTALGQVEQIGACSFSGIQTMFNVSRIVNDWYQERRILDSREVGHCSRLNISMTNNDFLNFENSAVHNKKVVLRQATVSRIGNGALFNVSYTDGVNYQMSIIETDFINFIVFYGCRNENSRSFVYTQVYVRNINSITSALRDQIDAAVRNPNIPGNAIWLRVEHTRQACDTSGGATLHLSFSILFVVVLMTLKNV